MALRLAECEPREYVYLCTPTGNELPEMATHWDRLEGLLGTPLTRITNRTLTYWIDHFHALPNWRMRWCTRLLKIEPCKAFLLRSTPATLYVGLRADEPARDGVIYGGATSEDYPLRRWGWGIDDVRSYLAQRDVKIPKRTDCAWCYAQRLSEWYALLRDHPGVYASAAALEQSTEHTFRSAQRDTWPAALADLRQEFELRLPRGISNQLTMFDDDDDLQGACRVCRM